MKSEAAKSRKPMWKLGVHSMKVENEDKSLGKQ